MIWIIFAVILGSVLVTILWIISVQRKLVILDENSNNAMCQIGVLISSRLDALEVLLNVTRNFACDESEMLIHFINTHRRMITAKSTPDDVIEQNQIIYDVLDKIDIIVKWHQDLKTDQTYITTMNAVEVFENMLRTTYMIYNDTTTKLNRSIRMFPVSIISTMLGFRKKDYIGEYTAKKQG